MFFLALCVDIPAVSFSIDATRFKERPNFAIKVKSIDFYLQGNKGSRMPIPISRIITQMTGVMVTKLFIPYTEKTFYASNRQRLQWTYSACPDRSAGDYLTEMLF